jgi:hypothetical protein
MEYTPSTMKIDQGFIAEAHCNTGKWIACDNSLEKAIVFETEGKALEVAILLCKQHEWRDKVEAYIDGKSACEPGPKPKYAHIYSFAV